MIPPKAIAVRSRGCPECGARPRQHCWSTFLGRIMINDVHRQRLRLRY